MNDYKCTWLKQLHPKAHRQKYLPLSYPTFSSMLWRLRCTSMGPASLWDFCSGKWGVCSFPSLTRASYSSYSRAAGGGGDRYCFFLELISSGGTKSNASSFPGKGLQGSFRLQFPYTGDAFLFGCKTPSLCPCSGSSPCRYPLWPWPLKSSHLPEIPWPRETHSSCCAVL